MQVSDIMTARVVSVDPYDRLGLVREIFNNVGFHHLLVVEKRKLVGVLSDRDFFKAISPMLGRAAARPRDEATLERRVHQIMSREVVTVRSATPLSEVVDTFLAHRISCLPVINDDREPQGIVSWRDLLSLLKRELPAAEILA